MSDLISKQGAIDILCKHCGITEAVEKCRKESAGGWCIEYFDLKNMPTVDAIPVEWIIENKNLARTVGAWQYELFLDTLLKDWEEEND